MAAKSITQKFCAKCKQTLPHEAFHSNKARADGIAIYCRTCTNAYSRSPERLAYNRARRAENREEFRAKRNQWYAQNREKVRAYYKKCRQEGRYTEWEREYAKRPEAREYRRKYREQNIEKLRQKAREYAASEYGKTRQRDTRYKRQYGISYDDYTLLLARQDGCCAICKNAPAGPDLAIDHDHTTGKVRGLLCNLCNTALGGFRDNISTLKQAIQYLLKHQAKERS